MLFQEVTPQLPCTSNGGSSDVLCYLWWMLSMCILREVCLTHLVCPWCSDVLIGLISRGARHSLLWVIWWEWSYCPFCANQEHMGRMMEEKLLEGMAADSIWILGSQRALGCCGIKRPGTLRVSSGAFHSISSDSQPDNFLLYDLEACRMFGSLCFWLLSPDTLIFLGLFCYSFESPGM